MARASHRLSNKDLQEMTADCYYCGRTQIIVINSRGEHMCKIKFDTEQFQEEHRKFKKGRTSHLISNKNFTDGTCVCSICGIVDMVKFSSNPGQCGNRYRAYNETKIKNPKMLRHKLSNVNFEERTAICSIDGPVEVHGSLNRFQCAIKRRETRKNQKKNNTKYYYYFDGGKHSLSPEERESMMDSFGNTCNMCGVYIQNRMHLDHDHKTGKFRGVLCDDHNLGLGRFHDSIDELELAIKYLQNSLDLAAFLL